MKRPNPAAAAMATFLLCFAAALLTVVPAMEAAESAKRPNILSIIVDDQSPFDPEHAGKPAEMEALLLAEMRRLDDPYRPIGFGTSPTTA